MSVRPLEGLMSVSQEPDCSSESPAAPRGNLRPNPHPDLRPNPHPDPRQPRTRQQVQSTEQNRASRPHHSPENAARERSRVRNLRQAFRSLQAALPSVPPDTKLSKLDVLVLATNYIAYLTETLDQGAALTERTVPSRPGGFLHPVKKWPMRSLLYCGSVGELLSAVPANQMLPPGQSRARH